MRIFILLLTFLTSVIGGSAQIDQFRMVGNISSFIDQGSGEYRYEIDFLADQTGNGYLPTQIQNDPEWRIFFQDGSLWEIDFASNLTFSSARIDLYDPTTSRPLPPALGQVILYNSQGRSTVPQCPANASGATPLLNAAINTYNTNPTGPGNFVLRRTGSGDFERDEQIFLAEEDRFLYNTYDSEEDAFSRINVERELIEVIGSYAGQFSDRGLIIDPDAAVLYSFTPSGSYNGISVANTDFNLETDYEDGSSTYAASGNLFFNADTTYYGIQHSRNDGLSSYLTMGPFSGVGIQFRDTVIGADNQQYFFPLVKIPDTNNWLMQFNGTTKRSSWVTPDDIGFVNSLESGSGINVNADTVPLVIDNISQFISRVVSPTGATRILQNPTLISLTNGSSANLRMETGEAKLQFGTNEFIANATGLTLNTAGIGGANTNDVLTLQADGTADFDPLIVSGNSNVATDGSGDVVISHSLGVDPYVTITNRSTTAYVFSVVAKSTSNFTVRVFDTTGAAVSSTAVNFDYKINK